MDQRDSHCPYSLSSEITAKPTVLGLCTCVSLCHMKSLSFIQQRGKKTLLSLTLICYCHLVGMVKIVRGSTFYVRPWNTATWRFGWLTVLALSFYSISKTRSYVSIRRVVWTRMLHVAPRVTLILCTFSVVKCFVLMSISLLLHSEPC